MSVLGTRDVDGTFKLNVLVPARDVDDTRTFFFNLTQIFFTLPSWPPAARLASDSCQSRSHTGEPEDTGEPGEYKSEPEDTGEPGEYKGEPGEYTKM